VLDWAAALDLRFISRGSSSTCVAWPGESIVDLTWANPAASGCVLGWEVLAVETLSDHLYIAMDVQPVAREAIACSDRADLKCIGEKKKEFPVVGGDPPRRGSHDCGRNGRRLGRGDP
jgi:hypothetical protein